MLRRAPLKPGKGFKPRTPQKAKAPRARANFIQPDTSRFKAMRAVSGEVRACPKESVLECREYRMLVAALPCKHCGLWGHSQCAHGNLGKGAGLKTDDRYTFPLCTVHCDAAGILVQGCHEKFDQGALFSKAVRRVIEPVWAADTRRQIFAMGLWPEGLPLWDEATEGTIR
jgi:hypothetical protein